MQSDNYAGAEFTVPTSLVIIAFTLTLAFSEGFRTVCAIMVRLSWAYFIWLSGLLKLWQTWGAKKLDAMKHAEKKRLDRIYKRDGKHHEKKEGTKESA